MKKNQIRHLQYLLLIFISLFLWGCGEDEGGQSDVSSQLKVLSGSELKDLKPILGDIKNRLESICSLNMSVEKIVNNQANYDLAWFTHTKYLSLLQGT